MTTTPTRSGRRPIAAQQISDLSAQVTQLTATVEHLKQALASAQTVPPAEPALEGGQLERYFPTLEQFVDLWLLPTFRRPLETLGMGAWRWCPRWWDHPEARLVFGALWDEWETNRSQQLGMIEFTRDVLQMMPEVCGEHGPFARCRATTTPGGFELRRHQHVPPAPTVPAPVGWWDRWWTNDTDGEQDPQSLLFTDVETFVTNLFLPTFRRDPNAVDLARWNWCDQWWAHDEAVHHLLNLWYQYEAVAPEHRLIEFVRETYFLLPHLHGDSGPMRDCTPTGHPAGAKHTDLTIAPTHHQVPTDRSFQRNRTGPIWP